MAQALREADLVVTRTYRTPMGDHACMEPDGAVAEPEGDGIVVWDCTKGVHVDRGEVARVLGLPLDKVHVIAATIGGSFGSKPDLPTVCMAALIAWKTKRAAQMVLTREEYFQVKTKRHPFIITMTHAVRRDGKILGLKVNAIADTGAYSSFTPSVLQRSIIHATGPYVVPVVDLEGRAAFTNNPITGAFRGYGEPQLSFALERQLDVIARELGLDPWELRMRNAMQPGSETSTGQVIDSAHMPEILTAGRRQAELLDAEDWAAGRLEPEPGVKRAWGMGSTFYGLGRTGVKDTAEVTLRLEDDGRFHLFVGCPDTGQGSDTALPQLAARGLGVPLELVRMTSADTALTRDAGTTTATRVTYIAGNAVVAAAAALRQRLLAEARRLEDFSGDASACRPGLAGPAGGLLPPERRGHGGGRAVHHPHHRYRCAGEGHPLRHLDLRRPVVAGPGGPGDLRSGGGAGGGLLRCGQGHQSPAAGRPDQGRDRHGPGLWAERGSGAGQGHHHEPQPVAVPRAPGR